MKKSLVSYLNQIYQVFSRGDAREESYYGALEQLIKDSAEALKKENVQVTTMPRKTEGGNPDFRVWDGKAKIVGYIEAKPPETSLDEVEDSEQVSRYRKTFPNFILTNFLEFRFYREGQEADRVFIGRQHTLVKVGAKPALENMDAFQWLLEKFFSFTFPKNLTAPKLASELAKRTRFLRDQVIAEELKSPGEQSSDFIKQFYEVFKTYLIFDLSEREFADLYAQTITYGLFAARTRCDGDFTRVTAYDFIPRSIGILHDVFAYISMGKASPQMEWIVDDIAEVLASIDVRQILTSYYSTGKGEDPVLYFYETFLAEYDPKLREKRGVYYTPLPVVRFIVNSLNVILKKTFNLTEGFGSTNVKVLDPAAGTMTFIAEAVKLAVAEQVGKYGEGTKKEFIQERVLKNFYAFELMMAPYTIGHMKMAYILEELGYKMENDDRFKLYLTNALEMQDIEQSHIPGISPLSEESKHAGLVKKEEPILVIFGNPPYSGISANMKGWIMDEIEKYKYVDGKHFQERKHWLQDDYVKFIRFAQWKIDQKGEGVVGIITNHGYLDNPTFRGMRQSLMKSFQEIYIVNLHGNSLKKEKAPDGSPDKNVFDIKAGVAIAFFIKKGGRNKKQKNECSVYHAETWGDREHKYDWLDTNSLSSVKWQQIKPSKPFYFFIPTDTKNRRLYNHFLKINDIFPVNVTGIVTARDHFVIDFEKEPLRRRIETFRNLSNPDDLVRDLFRLKDTRGWKFSEKRKELSAERDWDSNFNEILYRPFDVRFIYYNPKMVDWPRLDVMRHMLQENIGLLLPKQYKEEAGAFVTRNISGHKTVSAYDINYLFPLYIYPDKKQKALFENNHELNRATNFDVKLFNMLYANLEKNNPKMTSLTPETFFYYIYAVLYSTIYRKKYEVFLKTDFPRIPLTYRFDLLQDLSSKGERLASIHLMKSTELEETFSKFEASGDNLVRKVTFASAIPESPLGRSKKKKEEKQKPGCVYINDTQYFSQIPEAVWEYQIGGYQVMQKWLKDRKGRRLSGEDIRHYIGIAKALQLTIEIQKEIDELYPEVEKSLLVF